jgi:ATP-dependent DNA helicase Rep
LILMPTFLFQDNAEVLAKWQRKIRYMLLDEYQDTNTSQYMLVKMLVALHSNFTVVGDDDQSIYSWRGARPENLLQLQQDFPTLKVVKLEQNYRSTSRILKAANVVIDNNPHVFEKKLWSEMGMGDEIRVVRCNNEDHEAEKVAQEIIHRKLTQRLDFKDFAILYRGNHQSRILEFKLKANNIPYKMSGGQSFFGRAEIKDIMSYLRLVINPDDDTAFLRVINTPRREIGAATLEKLNHFAANEMCSLYSAAGDSQLGDHMPANAAEKLSNFITWMERIRRKLHNSDAPADVVKEMVYDIDYPGWLRTDSTSVSQADKRLENVWLLVSSLEQIMEGGDEDDESEVLVEEAVGKLVLRDLMERQEEDDEDYDAVQLMTLHASKGLEFPHCYMIGLEEEILPHRNSIESGDIEEERRLMYVGITRAKKTLALTYAAKRKQFGEIIECTPSRFLDEMPQEDLKWEGRTMTADDKSDNRSMGKATLASLMGML